MAKKKTTNEGARVEAVESEPKHALSDFFKSEEAYGDWRRDGSRGRKALAQLAEALASGADLNAQGPEGMTALGKSMSMGRSEMVVALLSAGADPEAPCADGRRPVQIGADRFREFNGANGQRALNALILSGARWNGIEFVERKVEEGYLIGEPLWTMDDQALERHWSPEVVEALRSDPASALGLRLLFEAALESDGHLKALAVGDMLAAGLSAPSEYSQALRAALASVCEAAGISPGSEAGRPLFECRAVVKGAGAKALEAITKRVVSSGEMWTSARGHSPLGAIGGLLTVEGARRVESEQALFDRVLPAASCYLGVEAIVEEKKDSAGDDSWHGYGRGRDKMGEFRALFGREKGWQGLGLDLESELARALPGFEGFARQKRLAALAGWRDPMAELSTRAAQVLGLEVAPERTIGAASEALSELGLSRAGWRALVADEGLRGVMLGALDMAQSEARKAAERAAREAVEDRMWEFGRLMREGPMGARMGGLSRRDEMEDMMEMEMLGEKEAMRAEQEAFAKASAKKLDEKALAKVSSACKALSLACEFGLAQTPAAKAMMKLAKENKLVGGLFGGAMPAYSSEYARAKNGRGLGASALVEEALAFAERSKGLALGMAKALQGKAGVDAVGAEWNDIADCVGKMPPGFWSQLDAKDPYGHAKRVHRDWVEELKNERVKGDPSLAIGWAPLLSGKLSMDGAWCAELGRKLDLYEEGKKMSHCVLSYADACASGRSRIFSLGAGSGERSTLELAAVDDKGERVAVDFDSEASMRKAARWQAVQHRGVCNAQVASPELLKMAREAVAAANASFKARLDELAAAREAKAKELAGPEEVLKSGLAKARARRAGKDVESEAGVRTEGLKKF